MDLREDRQAGSIEMRRCSCGEKQILQHIGTYRDHNAILQRAKESGFIPELNEFLEGTKLHTVLSAPLSMTQEALLPTLLASVLKQDA